MYNLMQWSLWITGLVLQFLLVSTLFSGVWRRYLAVFFYSTVLFLTTVVEIIASFDQGGRFTAVSAEVYWTCEFFRHAGLVGVVLASVAQAVPIAQYRRTVRHALMLFAIALWCGAFLAERTPSHQMWMTNAFRDISFSAAMINLCLWLTLIATRIRNPTLLMITGGLGIQMTGEAIGQSLRQLSPLTVLFGGLLAVFAHFLCLYIWIRAFRSEAAETVTRNSRAPVSGASAPGAAQSRALAVCIPAHPVK